MLMLLMLLMLPLLPPLVLLLWVTRYRNESDGQCSTL
jgi:hypothetical protein